MASNKEYIAYNAETLKIDKLEFKILTMVGLLADNNLSYTGTLKDINESLGYYQPDTRRNRNIKTAISNLEEQGLIKCVVNGNGRGQRYTLILLDEAQEHHIIKIEKYWVKTIWETFREKKLGYDWSYILKVLLYLIDTAYKEIYTQQEIAMELSTNQITVRKAINELGNMSLLDNKKIYDVWEKDNKTFYKCVGTTIELAGWVNTDN